jgi:hypothetical protein
MGGSGGGFLKQADGFTEEELDYIVNYDIKYKMGEALNGDVGEDE